MNRSLQPRRLVFVALALVFQGCQVVSSFTARMSSRHRHASHQGALKGAGIVVVVDDHWHHPTNRIHGLSRWRQRTTSTKLLALMKRDEVDSNRMMDADDMPFSRSTTTTGKNIKGLMPDEEFHRLDKIDKVLQELQRQVPRLLSERLTDTTAALIYTDDTQLRVVTTPAGGGDKKKSKKNGEDGNDDNVDVVVDDDIVLASSRDELIRVSTAVVVVEQASNRAAELLSSWQSSFAAPTTTTTSSAKKKDTSNNNTPVLVESKIVLQWNPDTSSIDWRSVQVVWKTNILPFLENNGSSSSVAGKLSGSSRLLLDPNGKITAHRLERVKWNDQDLDPRTIGPSLATLRQTFLTVQQSPLGKVFLSSSSTMSALSLLDQAQEELWKQQNPNDNDKKAQDTVGQSPIFVSTLDPRTFNSSWNGGEKGKALVPLDDFCDNSNNNKTNSAGNATSTMPIPGSRQWQDYARVHGAITSFCDTALPALQSLDQVVDGSVLEALFVPNVRLLTYDGSVLLQDATRVANFYRSLAVWRQRTFGSWAIKRLVVQDAMGPRPKLVIDYTTSIQLPGAAPVIAQGSDTYCLSLRNNDNDNTMATPLITEIKQSKLSMGDGYSIQDALWLMRTLATAVETDRWRSSSSSSSDGDTFWLDLLSRVSRRRNNKNNELVSSQKAKASLTAAPRSDAVALTTFRMMEALHVQGRALVDSSITTHVPPLSDYVSDQIQFVLGPATAGALLPLETPPLLRGRGSYIRTLGLGVASLRAALASGRVVSQQEPRVTVELTPQANLKACLTLYLQVASLVPGGGKFPLQIELMSEYVLVAPPPSSSSSSGRMIAQHRLVSTRINGQLTPADVLASWMQRLSSSDKTDGTIGWDRAWTDALGWVRSLRN